VWLFSAALFSVLVLSLYPSSLPAVSAETETQTTNPPIGRIFGNCQEISARAGLRGGGRSRSRTRLHSQIPC
jgi:hypothetical protein